MPRRREGLSLRRILGKHDGIMEVRAIQADKEESVQCQTVWHIQNGYGIISQSLGRKQEKSDI